MRKALTFVLVALLLMSTFMVASCSKGGSSSSSGSQAKTPAKEKVKIQIMVGFGTGTDPSQIAVHEELQAEFNNTVGKEKGIEIEFLTVPYSDAATKFTTLVAAGMTPDICGPVGVMGVAQFIDEWLDLTPYIEKDKIDLSVYDDQLVESNRYNVDGQSKLVGLPIGYYPSALFYNEDIYDRAGLDYPPEEWGTADWTYDKLYEQARQMTLDMWGSDANDPDFDMDNVTQYGYDGTDWSPWRAWVGKFFDENGKSVALGMTDDYKTATMNSPEWIKAFSELERMIYKEKVRPRSDAAAGASLFGDADPLGSNRLGVWETFSWMSYAFESWDANFSWNIGAIPSMDGHVVSATNIDTFVMCRSAKHPDEAWEVYKWLFSDKVYSRLNHNYGGIPAMKNLQAQWLDEQKAERPNINWQVLLDAGAYADNPNNESWVPGYSEVWNEMEFAMASIISGLYDTPEQVAEDLNDEVQDILDEYWASK
ncbi:MAG: extracellular solute-binding protein [Sphaerochaetaceae bacterium]|nr:extracellular solute-binding protein [Sphaerochaetaceae bacterium]